jgi:putative membrane protein
VIKIVTAVGAVVLGLLLNIAVAADPAPPLSDADKAFVLAADQFAQQEIAASHLATSKGSAATVQIFAKQMVEEYVHMHEHIVKVAAQANLPLPKMDAAREAKVTTLNKLGGSEFDRQYTSDEITNHTAAADTFEKAASAIRDPELKKWAEKRLKTVRENLQKASATQSKL